ncbi:MAG: hypothetical protein EOP04_02985 [Proteobacteria bacterium]|nr:MAG: hypothetical protein EOP04_02985 [Pseudomonadota bacterium]
MKKSSIGRRAFPVFLSLCFVPSWGAAFSQGRPLTTDSPEKSQFDSELSGRVELSFESTSTDLSESQNESLAKIKKVAKNGEHTVFKIKEPSASLKPSSMPYITAQARALAIFQALTREGIDPKRIVVVPVKTGAKRSNDNIIVMWSEDRSIGITEAFVPDLSATYDGTEYSVYFDSASAVPKIPDNDEFQRFLRAVGSSGKDAISIEGSTDSSGNKLYNEALGKLRARRAFEILVKTGLPAYRIETTNRTNNDRSKIEDVAKKASQRSVVFRWVVNTEIAKIAQTKIAEQAPKPASLPPIAKQETLNQIPTSALAAAPAKVDSSNSSTIDIFPYVGAILPVGSLSTNAKPATNIGLGIAKVMNLGESTELRFGILGTASSSLKAKKSDQSGPLEITNYGLRVDALRDFGILRGYVAAGLEVNRWKVRIQETPTRLVNSGSKNDLGTNIGMGAEFSIAENLWIGPEANWHYVFGGFNVPYVTTLAVLRWRIK